MAEREKREFIITLVGVLLFVGVLSYVSVDWAEPTARAVKTHEKVVLQMYDGEEAAVAEGRSKGRNLGIRSNPDNFKVAAAGGNHTNKTNHTACRNLACVVVPGSGENECRTNNDCRSKIGSTKWNKTGSVGTFPGNATHTVCRSLACVTVAGAGTNQCINNIDCNVTGNTTFLVFVSNTTVTGNMTTNIPFGSPLYRADQVCLQESFAKGYPSGSYRAWLSTTAIDARDRITNGKYVNVYGQVVANSRMDLLDGSLQNPIDIGRNRWPADLTWTGTNSDGTLSAGNNCRDWTSGASSGIWGMTGFPIDLSGGWTQTTTDSCSKQHYLYCFQT